MQKILTICLFLFACTPATSQSKKDLAEKVAALSAENAALRNQLSECDGHNKAVNDENDVLRFEIKALKMSNEQLRKSAEDKEAEIKRLRNVASNSANPAPNTSSAKSITTTALPPQTQNSNRTKTTSGHAVYSGRCQATTKAGHQCKRSAQPGRSYCWQH